MALLRHLRRREDDHDLQVFGDLGEVMFSTGVDRDHGTRADGNLGPLDVKLRLSPVNDAYLVGRMGMLMASIVDWQPVESERHTRSTQDLPVSFLALLGELIDGKRL